MKKILSLLALSLVLAACSTQQVKTGDTAPQVQLASWVEQSQLFIQQGQIPAAQFIIEAQDFNVLPNDERGWYVFLSMQINLLLKNPDVAFNFSQSPWGDFLEYLPAPYLADAKLTLAQVYEQNFLFLAAVRERIFIGSRLPESQKQANHDAIWQDFQQLSSDQILQLTGFQGYTDMGVWAELALISQRYQMSLPQLSQSLKQWQLKYRSFDAAIYPPQKLLPFLQDSIQSPKKIAVLLPQSGQFADYGQAIADGYLQAYYQGLQNNGEMEVIWFDTGADVSADRLYQRAVNAGVDIVIGPFQKQQIVAISQLPLLPVPVLALNKAVDNPPEGLYQFPLAPEDEAIQLARQAWQLGHDTAAIMYMKGTWGDRVTSAFSQEWSNLGGKLVSAQPFEQSNPRQALPPVKQLLGVSMSEAREGYLERTIANGVVMEARFRQDLDFIFLAALPEQGRLIRPMFDFLLAGDIPVYSISTIWNEQGGNSDLNGIKLLAPPWDYVNNPERAQLKQTLGSLGRENRLYALGLDAFLLQQHIWYLNRLQDHSINGYTGRLSLDQQGVVHRELQWFEVVDQKLTVPEQASF